MVSNFESRGTYTDLGDGSIELCSGSTDPSSVYQFTKVDLPNSFNWMKANILALLNGYTSNTFGIRLHMAFAQVRKINLSLSFTCT